MLPKHLAFVALLASIALPGCPSSSDTDSGPGMDTPGVDVPRMDTPGADVPGRDVPGLDVPGADVPGAPMDTPAVTCGATMCMGGQVCCASTGTCYDPLCLSCCMDLPDVPFVLPDVPLPDVPFALPDVPLPDVPFALPDVPLPDVPFSLPDVPLPRRDTGDLCAGVRCLPGLECCPLTGMCYDPGCLSCCMRRP